MSYRYPALILILLLPSQALSAERFNDPIHGMSFEYPAGKWSITAGLGNLIADMKDVDGSGIRIVWDDDTPSSSVPQKIVETLAKKYHGARLEKVEGISVGGRDVSSAVFGTGAHRGAMFLIPAAGGTIELTCEAQASKFLELFLRCRSLAAEIKAETPVWRMSRIEKADDGTLPSPELMDGLRAHLSKDPNSFALVSDLVSTRALFALLDGRSGCAGVADEPRRFATIAAKLGDSQTEHKLRTLANSLDRSGELPAIAHTGQEGDLSLFLHAKTLEQEGRPQLARQIYLRLENGRHGFFAGLALARLDLVDADVGRARKRLARLAGNSSLARALNVWAVRVSGDRIPSEDNAESLCGRSGAMEAYQMGIATQSSDPKSAERRFLEAIDADPSYVPVYVALGKIYMIDNNVSATRARLMSLLDRAPETQEIERLKRSLEKIAAK